MANGMGQGGDQMTGTWVGTYRSNEVPEPTHVVLIFQQLTVEELQETRRLTVPLDALSDQGTTVAGSYKSADGAIGTMVGTLDGGRVNLTATQVTPTCPGSFQMVGTLDENQFTWDFTGSDCLGRHEGSGQASRAVPGQQ